MPSVKISNSNAVTAYARCRKTGMTNYSHAISGDSSCRTTPIKQRNYNGTPLFPDVPGTSAHQLTSSLAPHTTRPTEDTSWKSLLYRMLRGRYPVDRIWRTLISRRKLFMTSAGPSVDQLPPPPPGHSLLVEGQAAIPFSEGNEVFYNKVQVFNRDLSIHVIKLFAEKRLREKEERCLRKTRRREGAEFTAEDLQQLESTNWGERAANSAATDGIRILDALAATALRSIRYVKEIPGVKEVLVNDLDEAAVQAAQRNIDFNQVDSSKIRVQQGDAIAAMHSSIAAKQRFDVIDLDPYGSAAPFLDAAVQAVDDGGLLCVTCTDMGVLSGGHPETCYAKYGSMPTKGRYLHEMALRIVLNALEAQANRYRRHIVPVLSLSIDFYVRLFVRVYTSPAEVKKACTKAAYVHQSLGCGSFYLQPVGKMSKNNYNPSLSTGDGCCPQTGKRFKVGGPIWAPPIHDVAWVQLLLDRVQEDRGPFPPATKKRIHGMLTSVSEELPDVPLFYSLPDMCSTLHCDSPRMIDVQAALVNAGYRVSQQHKEPQAVKTDAPDEVVWDIMRCWVKKHPVSDKRKTSSPGQAILAKEPSLEADFTVPSGLWQKKTATRYQQNPEPYWGPKARATGNKRATVDGDKPVDDAPAEKKNKTAEPEPAAAAPPVEAAASAPVEAAAAAPVEAAAAAPVEDETVSATATPVEDETEKGDTGAPPKLL